VAAKSIFSTFAKISLFLGVTMLPASTIAAELDATARYVVTLRGVNISDVSVSLKDNGSRYDVNIHGDVSGLASLVAVGTAALKSNGNSSGENLQSEKFALETRSNGDRFSVGFEARNADVMSFQVFPPLSENKNRVPVLGRHRKDINDPIAAFLVKADSLSPDVCNRTVKVFTGIERYDIAMTFAENQTATSKRTGYQGPVVLCRMDYRPISGHFNNSESTKFMQNNQRFLIWYAPLGDTGYMIPYRVLIGTAFGDLSMVLTRMAL